jgi:hypothetical protein
MAFAPGPDAAGAAPPRVPVPPCFCSVLQRPQALLHADMLGAEAYGAAPGAAAATGDAAASDADAPRLLLPPSLPCAAYCGAMGLRPLCACARNREFAPGTHAATLRDWALKRAQVWQRRRARRACLLCGRGGARPAERACVLFALQTSCPCVPASTPQRPTPTPTPPSSLLGSIRLPSSRM